MSRHRFVRGAAWAATVPLAGTALARVVLGDRRATLAALNAITPYLYLPAYPALAVGMATRSRYLTAVAAGVVAGHLNWTLPELRRARIPTWDPDSPRLRLASANVQFTSGRWDRVGAELAGMGADLVLIQELTPQSLAGLERAGAFQGLDFCHLDPRPGSFGSGIWSRHPLADAETFDAAGAPMTRATVKLGPGVRVYNVHTRSPVTGGLARWQAQLRLLAAEVAMDRTATGLSAVVAGDFNATWGQPAFLALLASGLRDAHVEVGRGWVATWRPRRSLPAVLRFDHVLVSPGLVVTAAAEGTGAGDTDHRPVVVDLAVADG